MPNNLDANGLTTATKQEQIAFLTGFYKSIYGLDIDLTSSSQDGQMLEIYVQVILDVEDLLAGIYSSRDINQAVGTQLDTLVYWIERQGASFTIQPLSVTIDRSVTLYGLDQTTNPVFTYQDDAGNQYQLQTTQSPVTPGTYIYNFQAAKPGNITSPLNSINVPVTVVIGVVAVNNPTIYTIQGINEESDFDFRIRALASVAVPSQGFFNGTLAAINNVPHATKAILYENFTDATNSDGMPPHSIWVIVQGTAAPADIAEAIYNERTLGCNMKGAQSFVITQADGSLFTVLWDDVVTEQLFVQFTATSIDGIHPPNLPAIIANLPLKITPGVGATVNVNEIQGAVQAIDPNTLVTNCGVSNSALGPFGNTVTPTAKNFQFALASANINVTPIELLPASISVVPTETVQFNTYGGTQTGLVYSFIFNNSGGTINPTTGLYTAGPIPSVDTVKVVDSAANTATAFVTVT